ILNRVIILGGRVCSRGVVLECITLFMTRAPLDPPARFFFPVTGERESEQRVVVEHDALWFGAGRTAVPLKQRHVVVPIPVTTRIPVACSWNIVVANDVPAVSRYVVAIADIT